MIGFENWKETGFYLRNQVQNFNVGYISIGNDQERFIGAGYSEGLRIGRSEKGYAESWIVDEQGNLTQHRNYHTYYGNYYYEFQKEDWFSIPKERDRQAWTRVYNWQAYPEIIAVSLGKPVKDEAGNLLAITAVDLPLDHLETFLQTLEISPQGEAFIIEPNGDVVAMSTHQEPFVLQEDGIATRLHGSQIENPALLAAFEEIQTATEASISSNNSWTEAFILDSDRYLMQTTTFRDEYGLVWLTCIIIPESDFSATLERNNRLVLLFLISSVILSLFLGTWASHRISRPVLKLTLAAQKLSTGNFDIVVHQAKIREINILGNAFRQMAHKQQELIAGLEQRVIQRTAELEEKNRLIQLQAKKLEKMAMSDPLTTLSNRRKFLAIAEYEHEKFQSTHQPYSILFIDLDFFKKVNDKYGHKVGDIVLIESAKRIKKSVRSTDYVARWGGEEFVLFLPKTHLQDAIKVGEKIRTVIEAQPYNAMNYSLNITCTIGVSQSKLDDSLEDIIHAADLVLYEGKKSGRNRVAIAR